MQRKSMLLACLKEMHHIAKGKEAHERLTGSLSLPPSLSPSLPLSLPPSLSLSLSLSLSISPSLHPSRPPALSLSLVLFQRIDVDEIAELHRGHLRKFSKVPYLVTFI